MKDLAHRTPNEMMLSKRLDLVVLKGISRPVLPRNDCFRPSAATAVVVMGLRFAKQIDHISKTASERYLFSGFRCELHFGDSMPASGKPELESAGCRMIASTVFDVLTIWLFSGDATRMLEKVGRCDVLVVDGTQPIRSSSCSRS